MTTVHPLKKTGGQASTPLPSVASPAKEGWKLYSAYKPSGAGWLGDVPKHWEVRTLGSLGRFAASGIDKKTVEGEPLVHMVNYLDVYHNTTHELTIEREYMEVSCPDWKRRAYAVKRGDMFFTPSSETEDDIGWSAVAIEDIPNTVFSYHILRFRPECALDLRFQKYWCNNHAVLQRFSWACQGTTRQILTRSDFRSTPVVFPPVAEQRAIADFLDRETGRIDRLVGKKRKLIETLKEERAALISRAVTRGLNPDVKLKPSGVEWFGDVPEHWGIEQLKWAIMFQRGHDLPSDEREEGSFPLVTSAGITSTHSMAAAKGPGIVTGRYGTIGAFHLVKEDYWPLNTTLYSISLRGNHADYLRYMLTHLAPLFLLNAVKSAVPGVDRNDIHPTKTVVPPLPEQRAIADYLDRETGKIDRLAAKVQAAIERMQEYRAALITAAVTGKIDVREVAALEYPEPTSELLKAAETRVGYRGN